MAFRVNRRPIGEGTLLPETMPEDAFDHFTRVLAPGYEVITSGRGHERSWRVGAVETDKAEHFVTGKLGWHRRDPDILPSWSEELKDWPTTVAHSPETLMPFALDGETRVLGVVDDKRSAPATLAAVFEKILNENERELHKRTTEWSVEPVLDAREFIDWLNGLDVVESVGFTARLPNPEPKDAFAELTDRMEQAHGTEYTARMKSKREEGLQHVEDDPEFRQAIAMGEQGFARLDGRGRRDGRESRYNQNNAVASENIPKLPESWEDIRAMLKNIVRERFRRFLLDNDEPA